MSEFLEKQDQRRIIDIITRYPGVHLTKIAEHLNMPIPQVQYHLNLLQQKQLIIISEEKGYKRFYRKEDIIGDLDNEIIETRQRIYDLIVKTPGLHQAKIAEILAMRKSLAEYHLVYLEKNEAIIAIKDQGYKRYYSKEFEIEEQDKKTLALVRQEIPEKIIELLLRHSVLHHKELAEQLKLAPSTLSYHLNKLVNEELIEARRYGEEKGYALKNRKKLIMFLIRYEIHTVLDRFKDIWANIY